MALRQKKYSYLTDDGYYNKMAKAKKKCVIKHYIKFRDYKNSLKNNEEIMKLKQRFRRVARNLFAEMVNKIALNTSDDKRLQALEAVTSYPYDTGAGRVCEAKLVEM